MVIEKEFLSLKDVADLCGTSNSNVSNWRTRDAKFPTPYTETAAGPLWKSEDIVNYLQGKFNEAYDAIASTNLSYKTIALMGRARVGKSFIISRFVNDRKAYVKLFCGNNKDKTACPIHVKISEHIILESFIFHSNFNSIYNGEEEKNEDISALNKRVSALLDHSYDMDSIEVMKEIESVIKAIREIEKNFPGRRNSDTYIDTYQKPNEYCKGILRECKLGTLQFVDTQGVSGEVEAAKVAKSDIYVFVLRPDNEDEAQTLKKIVTTIKSDVATSKAIFLYKTEGIYSSKEEYQEAREEVHDDMAEYSSLFDELKGNIISTDIDVLDPAGHCVAFPTMNKEKPSFQEDFFLEEIKEKIIDAFIGDDDEKRREKFQMIVKKYGKDAKQLVLDILKGIPKHRLGEKEEYTIKSFETENHDRVMTKDNYRLHNDLYNAYQQEIELLDQYFSDFSASNYPQEWKQLIIKYLFRVLTTSVRTDRGLGVGTHPWEEQPARTMLIEESIVADKVLEMIDGKDDRFINEPYRKALRECNISSASWNCVGCNSDDEAKIKLSIVKNMMIGIRVSNRQEMVLCRYVGGLRKIAEYNILTMMGYGKHKAMIELSKLPF